MTTTLTAPDARRAAYARGLRDLAAFIEANPDLPLPGVSVFGYHPRGTDADKRAEIGRVAAILGVTATGHLVHMAARHFGPIAYEAVAIPAECTDRFDALTSCGDSVRPAEAS